MGTEDRILAWAGSTDRESVSFTAGSSPSKSNSGPGTTPREISSVMMSASVDAGGLDARRRTKYVKKALASMSATCSEGGFMGVTTGGSATGALSTLPYELRGVRVIRFCDRVISSTALGEGTRIKAVSVGEWTIVIPKGTSPDQEGPVR